MQAIAQTKRFGGWRRTSVTCVGSSIISVRRTQRGVRRSKIEGGCGLRRGGENVGGSWLPRHLHSVPVGRLRQLLLSGPPPPHSDMMAVLQTMKMITLHSAAASPLQGPARARK